jgi:hypothetical protein
MALNDFDWQSVLAQGKPAGYINGPIVTDQYTTMTPQLQATLDYNKALRYQSSFQKQQEATQQYGAGNFRMTPAGAVPTTPQPAPPPDPNGFVIGGSVPAGTQPRTGQPGMAYAGGSPGGGLAGMGGATTGGGTQPPGEPTLNTSYTPNPYLNGIAADVTQQVNKNLFQTTLPNIRSDAIAAGGYGDNRTSILQGTAAGEASRGLAGSLASMYGNDFQQSQGRNLQQYGMDQGFWLGRENLDRNIFNDNMNWANVAQRNDLDLFRTLFNMNSSGAAAGDAMDESQTKWLRDLSQILAPYLNAGGTASTNFDTSPFMGAAGGAQLFDALFGGR